MFTFLFGCSRRWEMALLLFSGVCIVYTLRVNISVAATKMEVDFGWTNVQKNLVLSAFYWGYTLGQVPSASLIQQFGGKMILGLSILIPAILTLFNPAIFKANFNWGLLIRAAIGFFQSASFPAIYYFFHHWVPVNERTLICPFVTAGSYLGEIIGFAISGVLLEASIVIGDKNFGSWESNFYVFGIIGILWFPLWCFFAYEMPSNHPNITKAELDLIAIPEDNYLMGMCSGIGMSFIPAKRYNIQRNQRPSSFISISQGGSLSQNHPNRLVQSFSLPNANDRGSQVDMSTLKQNLLSDKDAMDNNINQTNHTDHHNSSSAAAVDEGGTRDGNKATTIANSTDKVTKRTTLSKQAIGVYNNIEEFEEFRGKNINSKVSEHQSLTEFQRSIAKITDSSNNTRTRLGSLDDNDAVETKTPLTRTNTYDSEGARAGRQYSASFVVDSEYMFQNNDSVANIAVIIENDYDNEYENRNRLISSKHINNNPINIIVPNTILLSDSIPWLNFFTHKESLVLFYTMFVFGFIEFLLISEMPSFLVDELGFSAATAGQLSSIPFACLFVTVLVSGRFFDFAQFKYKWEPYFVRQFAQISSFTGVAIFLVASGFATSNRVGAFVLISLAQSSIGISLSGIGCAFLDVAPVFACPMYSIANTLASLAGILGPLIASLTTSTNSGISSWRILFILCGALCLISIVLWRLYQTSTVVKALNTPLNRT